jgi:hypothetical protein
VDANKITLDRLEYTPGMEDTGSPDWLASIGAKFEDSAAPAAEAQPEWLKPAPAPEPDAAPSDPGPAEMPDWLRELQPPTAQASWRPRRSDAAGRSRLHVRHRMSHWSE